MVVYASDAANFSSTCVYFRSCPCLAWAIQKYVEHHEQRHDEARNEAQGQDGHRAHIHAVQPGHGGEGHGHHEIQNPQHLPTHEALPEELARRVESFMQQERQG